LPYDLLITQSSVRFLAFDEDDIRWNLADISPKGS